MYEWHYENCFFVLFIQLGSIENEINTFFHILKSDILFSTITITISISISLYMKKPELTSHIEKNCKYIVAHL